MMFALLDEDISLFRYKFLQNMDKLEGIKKNLCKYILAKVFYS